MAHETEGILRRRLQERLPSTQEGSFQAQTTDTAGASTSILAKRIADGANHIVKYAPKVMPEKSSERQKIDFKEMISEYVASALIKNLLFSNTSSVEIIEDQAMLGSQIPEKSFAVRSKFIEGFQDLGGEVMDFFASDSAENSLHVQIAIALDGQLPITEIPSDINDLIERASAKYGLDKDKFSKDLLDALTDPRNQIGDDAMKAFEFIKPICQNYFKEIVSSEIEARRDRQAHVKGFAKIIVASAILGDPDIHVGNIGTFRNRSTGELEFVKIDHGRSFQEVHETGVSLLQSITRLLDDFHYPEGMDISLQEMREAIRQSSLISQEEIEDIVDRRLGDLKASGVSIDIDKERAKMLSAFGKNQQSMKEVDKFLHAIELQSLESDFRTAADGSVMTRESFLQYGWVDFMRSGKIDLEELDLEARDPQITEPVSTTTIQTYRRREKTIDLTRAERIQLSDPRKAKFCAGMKLKNYDGREIESILSEKFTESFEEAGISHDMAEIMAKSIVRSISKTPELTATLALHLPEALSAIEKSTKAQISQTQEISGKQTAKIARSVERALLSDLKEVVASQGHAR